MAINFTDFSKAPIQESPLTNLWENAFKGYQIGRAPQQMDDEAKQRQLAIALKEKEFGHKDKEFELSDKGKELANSLQAKALETYDEKFKNEQDYKKAQTANFNKPQALTSALAQAFQVRNQFEKGSDDWNKANDYIDRLGKKSGGINVSSTPEGGFEVQVGGEGKTGYIPGVGKLPTGSVAVYDKEGKFIGQNTLLKGDDLKRARGEQGFNTVQPFLNKALSVYSGKGSSLQFADDLRKYSTDASAKERIDNWLAAENLLKVGATTENARVGGHNTNSQLKEMKSTLERSEVPQYLKTLKGYQLPKGYAEASGNIFKDWMDKVSKSQKNMPLYEFRPATDIGAVDQKGSALSNALDKNNPNKPEQNKTIKIKNKKTGETREVTVEEAAKLGVPNV